MPDPRDDLTISIYVPDGGVQAPQPRPGDPEQDHSLLSMLGLNRVEEVKVSDVRAQWAQTVRTVMELGASIRDETRAWTVEEMEVGLTLSATGKLLFIAEAGAEASIMLKLRRTSNPGSGAAITG